MSTIDQLQKQLNAVINENDTFKQKAKLLHLAMKALEMADLNNSEINLEQLFNDDSDVFTQWLSNSQRAGKSLIGHLSSTLPYLSPDFKDEPFEDAKKQTIQNLELTSQNVNRTKIAIEEHSAELDILKIKTQELEQNNKTLFNLENSLKSYKKIYQDLNQKINEINQDISILTGKEFLELSQKFIKHSTLVLSALNKQNADNENLLNTLNNQLLVIDQSIKTIEQKTESTKIAKQRLQSEKQKLLSIESALKQTELEYQTLEQKIISLETSYSKLSAEAFMKLAQQFGSVSHGLFKFFEEDFQSKQNELQKLQQRINDVNQKVGEHNHQLEQLKSENQILLNAEQKLRQIEQAVQDLTNLINHLKHLEQQFTPEFLQQKFESLKDQERIILSNFFEINDELIAKIRQSILIIQQQFESNQEVKNAMQDDLIIFDTNRNFKNPSFELTEISKEESTIKNMIQSIENRIKILLNQRDEMRRIINQQSSI